MSRVSKGNPSADPAPQGFNDSANVRILTSCSVSTSGGSLLLSLGVGDILSAACESDTIVASVFKGSYETNRYPQSLIAGIESRYGIDFRRELSNAEFDLRTGLSSWAFKKENSPLILIVEFEYPLDVIEVFVDMSFALQILVRKNMASPQGRILIPILGSGAQRNNVEEIAPALLQVADQYFTRLSGVSEVVILDRREDKIKRVMKAWNELLVRQESIKAASSRAKELIGEVREICASISVSVLRRNRWAEELYQLLADDEISSDTLPALSRRISESVVLDFWGKIDPKRKCRGLADDIEDLKNFGLAHWIIGYLHTLRQFGNYGSHHQKPEAIFPPSLEENDLLLCLQCIRSILPVWIRWHSTDGYRAK